MKNEYKKALMSIRNNNLDLNDRSRVKIESINEKSMNQQIQYLNKKTFNLISSKNRFKSDIGYFIAYNLLKKKTYKELYKIVLENLIEISRLQRNIRYNNEENEKIMDHHSILLYINQLIYINYPQYSILLYLHLYQMMEDP